MAVNGIQRERYILIDAITLGTVFLIPPDHGALEGVTLHHGNAALVTAGVAAVGIEGAGGVCLIHTTVRVV